MYRVIKQSKEDFVVDYPLTDEFVERTLKKYDKMSREDEEDYYDQIHHEGKYADKVYSAVGPWKTRYTVHWMSPDGRDCLLAGNNDLEEAVQSGINQVEELLDSPWETDERRLLFLENMYIAEGDRVIDTELDDYVDGVMSFIQSRMKMKKPANASTKINAWSTYEPSAAEYGEAMDAQKKRLADRYEPFVVKPVYFDKWSTNSTGYRITLDIEGTVDEHGPVDDFYYEEWILDGKYGDYKLYGSFDPGDIKGWSQLKPGTEIGTFKNIDEAMTWLFNNVDLPDED